jgi:hypothetical protein
MPLASLVAVDGSAPHIIEQEAMPGITSGDLPERD